MRRIRRRDGAFMWELFSDIEQPDRMVECFMVESWLEHLRQHERATVADREVDRKGTLVPSGQRAAQGDAHGRGAELTARAAGRYGLFRLLAAAGCPANQGQQRQAATDQE